MAVVLPIIAFILLLLNFASRGIAWRRSFLLAAISWGLLVTASTELLSLCHAINILSLSLFWGAVTTTAFCYIYPRKSQIIIEKFDTSNLGDFICIIFSLCITLMIAIAAPPNNWDSMTYHMARVMHWIQNSSVAYYPTHIPRQLYSAPWAEYAILHLQLLSDGDRFANLVQWFALVGSAIGVSLIVVEFGGDSRKQHFAALFATTIPMAVLQASSTQNDLVASFWLVCFCYFGIILSRDLNNFIAAATAISLGLAFLCKATTYIFALPFVVLILIEVIRNHGRKCWKYIFMIVTIIICLNAGHFWRNYSLWGNPLSTGSDKVRNEQISLKVMTSNFCRNFVTHTWTPLPEINLLQYRGVLALHSLIGQNVNDPETSVNATEFTPGRLSRHEDFAGNGLHLILACLAIIILAIRRQHGLNLLTKYTVALVSSALLYCILLKWQPWGTRLQLPFFILAAPLSVTVLVSNSRKSVNYILAALLIFCAGPWLIKNASRPLAGEWTIFSMNREQQYFVNNPQLMTYYFMAADNISKNPACREIALKSDTCDSYEYPLWVLIGKSQAKMPRIEHINVANHSATIALRNFNPCMQIKIY